jgi:hypothetical protein
MTEDVLLKRVAIYDLRWSWLGGWSCEWAQIGKGHYLLPHAGTCSGFWTCGRMMRAIARIVGEAQRAEVEDE